MISGGGFAFFSVLFLLAVHVQCRPNQYNLGTHEDDNAALSDTERRLLDLIIERRVLVDEENLVENIEAVAEGPYPIDPADDVNDEEEIGSYPAPSDVNDEDEIGSYPFAPADVNDEEELGSYPFAPADDVNDDDEISTNELEQEKTEISQIEAFLTTNNLEVPRGRYDDLNETTVHERLDQLMFRLSRDQDTVFIEHGNARMVAQSTVSDFLTVVENAGLGDIRLSPEQQATLDNGVDKRRVLLGSAWSNNEIPYEFDTSTLPSATTKALIRQAMALWQRDACVTFRAKDPADTTWLQIGSYGGCFSYVGQISASNPPQGQKLSIGRGCEHLGIIIHELGHAMGFLHEQSRQDRDEHITVHLDNIMSGRENNFRKAQTELFAGYDVNSIMHYGRTGFTKNGKPTITAKDAAEGVLLGNRLMYTFYDIKVANSHYKCADLRCSNLVTPSPVCLNTGYIGTTSCSTCTCPEGLGGNDCSVVDTSWTSGSSCGGVIHLKLGDNVNIESPNFPAAYKPGDKCAWLIKTAVVGSRISLKFLSMDTNKEKSTADYVEVRKNLPGQTGIFFRGDTAAISDPATPLYTIKTKVDGLAQMTVLFSSSATGTPGDGFRGLVTVEPLTVCTRATCPTFSKCVEDVSESVGYRCECNSGISGPNCDIVGAVDLSETFPVNGPYVFSVDDWTINSGTTPSSGTGPDGGHPYNLGLYLYYETTSPVQTGDKAYSKSTVSFDGDDQRCLDFAFHMFGSTMGTLSVMLEVNGGLSSPIFTVTGDQGQQWNLANVAIPRQPGVFYKIVFEGIKGSSYRSDIAIDSISINVCNTTVGATPPVQKTTPTPPTPTTPTQSVCASATCPKLSKCVEDVSESVGYRCECNSGISGTNCDIVGAVGLSETFPVNGPYVFSVDEWTLNSGTTKSAGTGPDGGYPTNIGFYLYYETSSPVQTGDKAYSKSTVSFDGDVTRCLEVAYHMYGTSMGTLSVMLEINGVLNSPLATVSGDQGQQWHLANVTIPRHPNVLYKVVFEGIKGRLPGHQSGYQSDMAIDSISINVCNTTVGATPPVQKTTPTPPTPTPPTPTSPTQSVCASATCSKLSNCVEDVSESVGYRCECNSGISGTNCDIVGAVGLSETFPVNGPYVFSVDEWTLNSGTTKSTGTGPDGGYPTNLGFYLYYETSSPVNTGDKAYSKSTVSFDGDVTRCLDFAYHMYGSSMGTLSVMLEINGVLNSPLATVSGDQGRQWHLANVTIPRHSNVLYKVVFEGIKGSGYQSDMAIDSISINVCNTTVGATPPVQKTTPTPPTPTPPTPTSPTQSVCASATCSKLSNCVEDVSESVGYRCECNSGISGTNCDIVGAVGLSETFPVNGPYVFSVDEWTLNSGTTKSAGTGPDGGYPTNIGFYLYYETSSPVQTGDKAYSKSTVSFDGDVTRCLEVAYHMYGTSMGTLSVMLEINGVLNSPLATVSGDQGQQWHLANVTIPRHPNVLYKVVFEGIKGRLPGHQSGYQSDMAIDSISINVCNTTVGATPPVQKTTPTPPTPTPPTPTSPTQSVCASATCSKLSNCVEDVSESVGYRCECNSGISGTNCDIVGAVGLSETFPVNGPYVFSVDEWTLNSGTTKSTGTGPDGGYPTNLGFYLYYETSSPVNTGDKAYSKSTVSFDGDVTRCLDFAYHMYGSSMGTLSVMLEINGVLNSPLATVSGDQGRQWHLANVTIPRHSNVLYKVVFEGIKGSGYQSDMAIDSISINVCKPPPTTPSPPPTTPSPTPVTTPSPTPVTTPQVATVDGQHDEPILVYTDGVFCDFEEDLDECLLENSEFDPADFVRTDSCFGTTSPCADHTTGKGYYLVFRAEPTMKQSMGVLVGPWLLFDTKQVCVGGYFQMDGSGAAEYVIEPLVHSESMRSGVIMDQTTTNGWEKREITIDIIGTFKLLIEARVDNEIGSISIDDIYIKPGSCDGTKVKPSARHYLFFDDFDTTTSGFNKFDVNSYNWTKHQGSTPSSRTGPDVDYSGTGYYMFTEASNPRKGGDTLVMISRPIQTSTPTVCLEFMLYDYGSHMGTFNVTVQDVNGDQVYGESILLPHSSTDIMWKPTQVTATVDSATVELVFTVSVTGWAGDYAVDNVKVYSGQCV